jgi:anaerobic selenocysteine-containing dehydrogenase
LITVLNGDRTTGRGGRRDVHKPAVDLVAGAGLYAGGSRTWSSRVRGLHEFGGELPVATLADEIETPGDGQIRAMVTHAGNPVLSTPNGGRLDRALGDLEFMVSFDFFINETTRHAHVILPPAFALERDHYDTVFHTLAIRNTAKFSRAVFTPSAGAMQDWEILSAMTTRLRRGAPEEVAKLRAGDAKRAGLGPRTLTRLRSGPYGGARTARHLFTAALDAAPVASTSAHSRHACQAAAHPTIG